MFEFYSEEFMRGYQEGYKTAMFELSEIAKRRYEIAGVSETSGTFVVSNQAKGAE